MSITVITDRERIARDALESIAARGARKPLGQIAKDVPYPHRCSVCSHVQNGPGVCLNRECPTAIAQKALDQLRRVS